MAEVVDVRTGKRVIIEFLPEEGSSPIKIHRCLRSVFVKVAVRVSSVQIQISSL
jgi:hypothetical protein